MRLRALVGAAVAAGALGIAAPADAGTYTAYACNAAGTSFGNRSWTALTNPAIVTDTACEQPGSLIGIRVDPGKRVASGAVAGLTYTSPAGTAIVDFTVNRQLDYKNPAVSGTHQLFTLYQLGPTVFAGAGDYNDAIRSRLNAQRSWYGYPANEAHVARSNASLRGFPALAGYRGDARQLIIRAGCFPRGGTPCQVGPGGRIYNVLYGTQLTINDFTAPAGASVDASGLLAGGPRDGSDPVTVSAADNAGIKRVEIVDATDPAARRVVGVENYDVGFTYEAGETKTDAGATCSFRLVKVCPDLNRETLRARSLQVGRRALYVRFVDAGENAVERGPYVVDVATPSDRGPVNGSNAREPARVILRFAKGKKTRRTVRYRRKAGIRGRLIDADGQPIAGAELKLLTRDLRPGASAVARKTFKTRADGSFRFTVRAKASRQLQVAWRARANDARFAANGYLRLKARASGTLKARPHAVRVGRRVTLSGRLKGVRRGGVPIVLQGRLKGSHRWSTFADTTSSRRGTFRARYRFRDAASRGRRFAFRARIRRAPGFPYETGTTRSVTVRVG